MDWLNEVYDKVESPSPIYREHGKRLLLRVGNVVVATILFCLVVLVSLIVVVLIATDALGWLAGLIIIGVSVLVAYLSLWSLRCYIASFFESEAAAFDVQVDTYITEQLQHLRYKRPPKAE